MREFKINSIKFRVSNNCFCDKYKYTLLYFDDNRSGWIRITSLNRLLQAKEEAKYF